MSGDTFIVQNVGASLTYLDDWTNRLALAYPGQSITISSAAGAITGGGTITASPAVGGAGKNLTFHVAIPSVPPSTNVVATLTATLSNSDVDVRKLEVRATS